ncbi:MAG: 16S rRNA (adenine(1518)-N(6)/adenine(1519)-N(6))-dimethyltransferase RsmA [Deltaproteobacteria bacterium]|nr:16S rRNA (adenine(1518)-N(6)/adenine(1519)-N(6))-dimethyltransferase RsmA [Deltaproteobacteria bacterium]
MLKKKYGQHFLVDPNIVRKIIGAALPLDEATVLEVGPGDGALTSALLAEGALVTAVEIDRDLAFMLKKKFSGVMGFSLVEADALKTDFTALAKKAEARFKCVANLPYNISGPLLIKFTEERDAFLELILMFQKEVAERLVAAPSTPEYGSITAVVGAFMEVKKLFDVSPNCFKPRPKVWSTVLRVRPLESPLVGASLEPVYRKVVRAAFGQRRKTLANALKTLGLGDEVISEALKGAGIDPKRRGETLDVAEFARLSEEVSAFLDSAVGGK